MLEIINNPKYKPYFFLITFLMILPLFAYMNFIFFELKNFDQTYSFTILILKNLNQYKGFKKEIYLAFLISLTPLLALLYLTLAKSNPNTHGKARWAQRKDIERYVYNPLECIKNIFLFLNPFNLFKPKLFFKRFLMIFTFGRKVVNPMKVNFGKGFILGLYQELGMKKEVCYDAPLCSLVIAPPGSGKTAAIAIPNLLSLKTSCIILDIKGELCDLTAGYRQQALKNKIFIFNPLGNDNTLKFNPFDKKIVSKLDFNRKRRLVDEVANTIFADNDSKDPHWTQQAKNLFTFYALYDLCTKNESTFFEIATAPIKDYRPLIHPESPYYKELYKTDKNGELLKEKDGKNILDLDANPENLFYRQVSDQIYLDRNNPKNYDGSPEDDSNPEEKLDQIIRNDARRWANANANEFASIKSVFGRYMQVFTSYQVREATNSMSFEYEDLRKENITLYVKIAQTDIDTLAPLIRILLESIAKNLLTRETKDPNETVYWILDEFVRFGKLQFLLEMPALCRSYKLVGLYITQSNALIEKYYSKEDAKIINATVAYKVIFKTDDIEYAETLSKEIGKYTRKSRNESTKDGALIFGGTSSISTEGWDLVSQQDIMNIGEDEVIVLASGHKAKPLKLIANFYFKSEKLKNRLEWEIKPNEEIFPEMKIKKNNSIGVGNNMSQKNNFIDSNKENYTQSQETQNNVTENLDNSNMKENQHQDKNPKNYTYINPDGILKEDQEHLDKELQKYRKEQEQKETMEYQRLIATTYPEAFNKIDEEENKKEYILKITNNALNVILYPPNSRKTLSKTLLQKIRQEEEYIKIKKQKPDIPVVFTTQDEETDNKEFEVLEEALKNQIPREFKSQTNDVDTSEQEEVQDDGSDYIENETLNSAQKESK